MAKQRKKSKQPKVLTIEPETEPLIEEVKGEPREVQPTSSEMLYGKQFSFLWKFLALPYFINEKFNTTRHLFLKIDPSNEKSLIVSNIPPFLPEVRD